MINTKFFRNILNQYADYRSERHQVIQLASDALRASKQAIFSLHRDKMKDAASYLKKAETIFRQLQKKTLKNEALRYEGSYRDAAEEYAEAKLYYQFLNNKKIDQIKEVKLTADEYLGGIADLTGELARKALPYATIGDVKKVEWIKAGVSDVVEQLIQFDLVGKLRNKYEEVKRNLKKIEEILYDLEVKH